MAETSTLPSLETQTKTNKKLKLLPKQEEAIFSNSPNIGYGGAWGCGKTIALCVWIATKATIKNNLILIGRKTYDELRDTTQLEFFGMFPELTEFHNKNENATYLPNGTTILWRHLDEWHKLSNLNLGAFAIDQAEEVSEDCYIALQGRLRRQVEGRQCFIVFNTEGHNWIWKLFKNKPIEDYHLIETTSFDNPHLPDDYFKRLKNLPQNVIKRYVFGSWAVFEGQVWEDFVEAQHTVYPFEIPQGWDRIVVLDHGVTNPTAVLWGAADHDGNIFIYDEHYESGQTISYHAEKIKERDNANVNTWLIDPSCKAKILEKAGTWYSILDEYADYGLHFFPANNDVLAGINRVGEYFKLDKLKIFKSCTNLIEEINQYKWQKVKPGEEKNAPDKPVKHNDHLCDGLRYLIMSRLSPSVRPEPKPERGSVAEEMSKLEASVNDWRSKFDG